MDTNTSSRAIVISVPSRLVLIVRDGPCTGQTYDTSTLNCSYLTVGRKKVLRNKSIAWIKDDAVSENHAEIKWDFKLGSWTLKDTNSSNGTKLNGIALEPQCEYAMLSKIMLSHLRDPFAWPCSMRFAAVTPCAHRRASTEEGRSHTFRNGLHRGSRGRRANSERRKC
ncbi:hypothetical protein Vafri_16030 [Volvox africanus]|uniref:FHA domain-containing protein n=1 Tax=Volvox africanus TaxID=51714 RepID=A0A8J4BGE6_9CHLO|nr:hypothetical protein Vafri_16030 [Volvox africanus]